MSALAPLFLTAGLLAFTLGGLAALVLARRPGSARPATYGACALGGALTAAAGLAGLGGEAWHWSRPGLLPPPGVELSVDGLAAFFLVLVGGAAVPCSIYAIGYLDDRRSGLPGLGVAYAGFLASMALVPIAGNVLTFLVAWELSALSSYFLVMADPDDPGVPRAGWVYALVTHAGLACLLAGMLLLAHFAGSDRFADWPGVTATLPPGLRALAFALLALGFGSKAGLVPLHVWLPLAHPAAPSHVSALMSGVMIKLGVYGLLRVGFDWLGQGPAWWGAILLLVGAGSALLGVLYALVEHDLKRLLAYHSVENVGIILLGVGAAIVFRSSGRIGLAQLGLVAALYHTLNHATFKALLFLGAGAVVKATGTRNIEAMGGLIKRMPWTAACFLVGSAAISALPPLNGFVSEWLTFMALLQSSQVSSPGLNLVFLIGLAALALTGGLAAACFVKAFGISFLALPRSEAAADAREVSVMLRGGMVALAAACVVLGLLAPLILPALGAVAAQLGERTDVSPLLTDSLTVVVGAGFANLSPLVVAALLALTLAALPLGLRAWGAGRGRRLYEPWSCGRSLQTARMEYTATAFSQPFKRVFAILYRPVKQLDIEFHPASRFFVRRIHYENPTRSLVEEWLYLPALVGARRLSRVAQRLQSGSASLYLAYILAVLLLLLLWARP